MDSTNIGKSVEKLAMQILPEIYPVITDIKIDGPKKNTSVYKLPIMVLMLTFILQYQVGLQKITTGIVTTPIWIFHT